MADAGDIQRLFCKQCKKEQLFIYKKWNETNKRITVYFEAWECNHCGHIFITNDLNNGVN